MTQEQKQSMLELLSSTTHQFPDPRYGFGIWRVRDLNHLLKHNLLVTPKVQRLINAATRLHNMWPVAVSGTTGFTLDYAELIAAMEAVKQERQANIPFIARPCGNAAWAVYREGAAAWVSCYMDADAEHQARADAHRRNTAQGTILS